MILISLGLWTSIFLSLVNLWVVTRLLSKDSYYLNWENSHEGMYAISLLLGWLNIKFFCFQFSRAFGARSMSAPLEDRSKFKYTKNTLILMVILAGLIVTGCGVQITFTYYKNVRNLTYVLCIDCIVVYSIGILTTLMYLFLRPARMFENIIFDTQDSERSNVNAITQPL